MQNKSLNTRDNKPLLAIIVPCYNEEEALVSCKNELIKIMCSLEEKQHISRESFIAFIDDGSRDKTWELACAFNKESPVKIKGLKLSRNFGHQNALLAGMLNFEFDICITMDADLQDNPGAICGMLEKYEQGYDIVYGVRSKRNTDNFLKKTTAHLFYILMKFLGVKIVYNHADFRLISRRVINKLKDFREVNIFLRGIIPYLGFNSAVVYYDRNQRIAGETKYSFKKMSAFAWDGITSFSIVPLRIITFIGLLIFIFSLILSLYVLISKYFGRTILGWTSLALSVYLLGGLTIFFLGIIGEYIGKIYMEVKQRPRFIVEAELE